MLLFKNAEIKAQRDITGGRQGNNDQKGIRLERSYPIFILNQGSLFLLTIQSALTHMAHDFIEKRFGKGH